MKLSKPHLDCNFPKAGNAVDMVTGHGIQNGPDLWKTRIHAAFGGSEHVMSVEQQPHSG